MAPYVRRVGKITLRLGNGDDPIHSWKPCSLTCASTTILYESWEPTYVSHSRQEHNDAEASRAWLCTPILLLCDTKVLPFAHGLEPWHGRIFELQSVQEGFRRTGASPHQTSCVSCIHFGFKPCMFCQRSMRINYVKISLHWSKDDGNGRILQVVCVAT